MIGFENETGRKHVPAPIWVETLSVTGFPVQVKLFGKSEQRTTHPFEHQIQLISLFAVVCFTNAK